MLKRNFPLLIDIDEDGNFTISSGDLGRYYGRPQFTVEEPHIRCGPSKIGDILNELLVNDPGQNLS